MFSITSIMRRLRRPLLPRHMRDMTMDQLLTWAGVERPDPALDTRLHWGTIPDHTTASGTEYVGSRFSSDDEWFGPDWDERQASWQYRAIDWASWPEWFESLPRWHTPRPEYPVWVSDFGYFHVRPDLQVGMSMKPEATLVTLTGPERPSRSVILWMGHLCRGRDMGPGDFEVIDILDAVPSAAGREWACRVERGIYGDALSWPAGARWANLTHDRPTTGDGEA